MQYKRWVAKHGIAIPEEESLVAFSETEDDEMDYGAEEEFIDDEDQEEEDGSLSEWLKEWVKREQVSEKVKRIAKI